MQNLDELRTGDNFGPRPGHLSLVEPEMNGGKISRERIDTLASQPGISALTISGLQQDTLEYLVSHYGPQLRHIHFWKCPRIADFSPLESLPELQQVAAYWNQKATRLWDFRKTPRLRGLGFKDFNHVTDLADLAYATSLEELNFGGMISVKTGYRTLDPLSGLTQLKQLSFSAKGIEDERIEPLAALTQLDELEFSASLFTLEQLAWLRAHLPVSAASSVLVAVRPISQPFERSGKRIDCLVMGKKGPFLDSVKDVARMGKYQDRFDRALWFFGTNPLAALEDFAG